MNTYVTLACLLLAVAASAHGSGYDYGLGGYGGSGYGISKIISAPILAPAVSTANVYKAAPIPIIKSVSVAPIISAPIISAPVLKTIPVASYNLGDSGLGGYGLGYGGYDLGYGKSLSYGLDYGYGKHY